MHLPTLTSCVVVIVASGWFVILFAVAVCAFLRTFVIVNGDVIMYGFENIYGIDWALLSSFKTTR